MSILSQSMNPVGIESRFKDAVSVEENRAVDGSEPDEEGVVSPDWVPVPGLSAVPCLIYEDQSQRAPQQEFSEDLTTGIILFAMSPALPRDKLLRFASVDHNSGKTIHRYATGKITHPADAYQRVRFRLGAIQ